jgi:eukaryotic-like serine/threonine-protein kinase
VQVPGLIGQSLAQAEPMVEKAQLQLKTEAKSAGAKPGTIVDQDPKADARVAPGTVVTAFVQPEPEMVTVPDAIGVPADKVAPFFQGKLEYEVIGQRVVTGKVPVHAIANQSPAAGQRVPVGTKVALTAEAPSVQVPDLRGKRVSEAQMQLNSMGLVFRYGDAGNVFDSMPQGVPVVSQSHEPGTRVALGEIVVVNPKQ